MRKKNNVDYSGEVLNELLCLSMDLVFVRDYLNNDNQEFMERFVLNSASLSYCHLKEMQSPFEKTLGNLKKDESLSGDLKELIDNLKINYGEEEEKKATKKIVFQTINHTLKIIARIKKCLGVLV